jgi:predicted nucleic acid-binding Zn ribbon protein
MHLIGKTNGGGVLVELIPDDLPSLKKMAGMAAAIAAICENCQRGPAPGSRAGVKKTAPSSDAGPATPRAPTGRSAPRAKRGPPHSRDKTCAVCGKGFHDESKTNTKRFCSEACRKAGDRQVRARHRRAAGTSPGSAHGAERVKQHWGKIRERQPGDGGHQLEPGTGRVAPHLTAG